MFVNKNKNLRLNIYNIIQILKNLYYLQDKIFNIENKYCLKYCFIAQQIFYYTKTKILLKNNNKTIL